ncbi:MAG: molybdopterin-binding protein [Hyphomicrobiaceae bacterium]|nr:molybdopterin-binding protein [Hyphomicrobiaceae bacterium]
MSKPEDRPDHVTAAILVIGDEILSGRTKDRNVGHIADVLTAVGIDLREVRIVADVTEDIVAAVDALRRRYTYLFTTGGIGPTHDDITADAIAAAFGVPIDVDERALALMRPHYERRGLPLTPSRLRMARLPKGSELIENSISAAPGFRLENVVVLAGVPSVMQVMLDAVLPSLKTGRRMLSQAIDVNVPEGDIADLFAAHQSAYPDVSMGSYPSFSATGLRCQLVLRSTEPARLEEASASLRETLAGLGYLAAP